MTVEERMSRNANEDKIALGEIAEKIATGDSGAFLRAIIEGIKSDYISKADTQNTMPADRALGVITGLTALQQRLDQAVVDKRKLQTVAKGGQEVKPANSEDSKGPHEMPLER